MALAATSYFEMRSGGTAGMLNGGGFNTGATFGITDATTDANTANTSAPIVSSATYNFVASDKDAWLFVAAGTSWIPGFYQITAVGSNKATLNAAIGAAVIVGASGRYDTPSTVLGCATVGTPTGGTIGVDYSQQNTADATATDYASAISSTTLTSASNGFKLTHIGNYFHLTTTGVGGFGLVGWYMITAYTSAGQVTTDRTTNNGTALAGGTGYVGGALDLTGSLADTFFESAVAGNTIFFKNGAFSLGIGVAISSASATATSKINMIGYNAVRGDSPTLAQMPVVSMGGNTFSSGGNWDSSKIVWTGTSTSVFTAGANNRITSSKFVNTSTTVDRTALNLASAGVFVMGCEMVSQNGRATVSATSLPGFQGNNLHDSDIGFLATNVAMSITNNIFHSNKTAGYSSTATDIRSSLIGNTFYGSEAKVGSGIRTTGATGSNLYLYNNIIYGCTTGIDIATVQQDSIAEDYNDFFNNTTDRTRCITGAHSVAINPSFVAAAQITGSTATTSGSVLTQSGGDFSTVVDNFSYLRVTSGTSVTVGIYLITSHTGTTVTVNNALGTSSAGNVVYTITNVSNLRPTGAL